MTDGRRTDPPEADRRTGTGETVTKRSNGPTAVQGAGGRPAAPGAGGARRVETPPKAAERSTVSTTRPAPAQKGSGPVPATKTLLPGWAGRTHLRQGLFGVAVVLLLVLPAVVAGLLSAGQDPTYEARAEILYQRVPVTDEQTVERELATQQVLLQSRPFIETAADSVRRERDELTEDVTVELVEESSILQLAVRDDDRDRARAAATSLVDQYIAAVEARSAETSTAAQERALLQPQIDAATTRLQEISARLRTLVPIPVPSAGVQVELRDLESERGLVRQQLTDLQAQVTEIDRRALQEGASPTRVVTPPFLLDDPVGPQPLRAAAAGLLVGVILATALLAGLRQRNRRSARPAP